jgi:hypothetical protein
MIKGIKPIVAVAADRLWLYPAHPLFESFWLVEIFVYVAINENLRAR